MWAKKLIAPATFGDAEFLKPNESDLRPGEVIVRTLVGGICGSDLPHFKGINPLIPLDGTQGRYAAELPGFPMHELVGEVMASAHPDHVPGRRVVGWASSTNGLAEYVVTHGDTVVPYPQSLEPHHAIMIQPLACVIHAVQRMRPVAGRKVAVLGLGPIGVLFGHVLKHAGAAKVTGVDRVNREDVSETFGLDEFVHTFADRWASTMEGPDDPRRPDLVVEAIGHQVGTLDDAIEGAAFGGEIFYFGIPDNPTYPFPMMRFLRKNLTMTAGATTEQARALRAAADYLQEHPDLAKHYVTDVVPLSQVQSAYERACHPTVGQLKVVVDMTAISGL